MSALPSQPYLSFYNTAVHIIIESESFHVRFTVNVLIGGCCNEPVEGKEKLFRISLTVFVGKIRIAAKKKKRKKQKVINFHSVSLVLIRAIRTVKSRTKQSMDYT